jgi:hypothetical protein
MQRRAVILLAGRDLEKPRLCHLRYSSFPKTLLANPEAIAGVAWLRIQNG